LIVNTKHGQIRGVDEGNLHIFRGIPYAEPPIGERRFTPPCPLQPWADVLQADRYGPISHQPVNAYFNLGEQSEDCLSLNIWTPGVDQANRPVLVDIHGGGFISGTGAFFSGYTFAQRDNIVCVSINYRLGALGFLYLGDLLGEAYQTSGNNGILDIVAALRWVKENISTFGGDPNRITVSGGSAGAKCVSTLLTVPAAQGLFHQIIAQSGATQAIRDTHTASRITLRLLDKLSIPHNEAHRLLTLPAQTILEAQENSLHTFGPVRDELTISLAPINELLSGLDRKIPMLVGTNKDECVAYTSYSPEMKEPNDAVMLNLFGSNSELVWAAYREAALLQPAQEAWSHTLTEYVYHYATIRLAEMAATLDQPLWLYRFEFSNGQGAIHGSENPFIFNFLQSETESDQTNELDPVAAYFAVPQSGKELAVHMHAAWAAFIHTGRPNTKGMPEWPMFNLANRPVMILNQECKLEREPVLPENHFPNQVFEL
jgi:para-nitrobenzyl esterase